MSLFSKKEKNSCCGNCNHETLKAAMENQNNGMAVKILGSGCSKCNALEASTLQALQELNLDTSIEHVKDFAQIASYGVMTTPALVYNGKVLTYGKILNTEQVKILLQNEINI